MHEPNFFTRWKSATEAGGPDPLKTAVVYKQLSSEVTPEPGDSRCVRFVITTDSPDRERDVVTTPGIDTKNYERNPVVLFGHDYKSLPVGRCVSLVRSDNNITAMVEFATADLNPMAEQVYRMVKGGFLKATSIGFRPTKWAYNEERKGVDFAESELLEFSVVPVPANAEALIAASASGIDTKVLKDWAARIMEQEAALAAETERVEESRELVFVAKNLSKDLDAAFSKHAAVTAFFGDPANGEPSTVRWNPRLSKSFDVAAQEFPPRSAEQALVAKYAGCAVKALYHRCEPVMSAKMGTFLSALDEVLQEATEDDLRNLNYKGEEEPPLYEKIQLNSKQTGEFLIDGLRFLQWNRVKMALRVEPRWYGLNLTAYASRAQRGMAEGFIDKVKARAKELNFLKGEAFTLAGEFLTRGAETFSDLFLEEKNQKAMKRITDLINERGSEMENRGALLVGPPGTGKTLSGRILMNQANATFIWCSSRDFAYMGGFRGMEAAFELARENSPCILFMEDVDNWMSGTTTDLMKTEMDGLKQYKGVVTILTTNYPELLPKALIDRPGRFHDVLRFDLPDAAARQKMLEKWLPGEYTATMIAEVGKATAGYSGAHMRELARFVTIIMSQDGLSLQDAMTSGLAKLAEQRDLITAVQSTGSRYRAPEHVQQKAAPEPSLDELVRGDVCAGPFTKDEVGWKAFVKARNRAATKGLVSDATIAALVSDFGFEDEAVLLAAEVVPDEVATARALLERSGYAILAPGRAAHIERAGRVLSKANADKLAAAAGSLQHAKDTIEEVLRSAEREEELPPEPEPSPTLSATEEEFGFEVETRATEDVFGFEIEERAAATDDLIEVDATVIQEAMREAFAGMAKTIQDETRAALNAARGRID